MSRPGRGSGAWLDLSHVSAGKTGSRLPGGLLFSISRTRRQRAGIRPNELTFSIAALLQGLGPLVRPPALPSTRPLAPLSSASRLLSGWFALAAFLRCEGGWRSSITPVITAITETPTRSAGGSPGTPPTFTPRPEERPLGGGEGPGAALTVMKPSSRPESGLGGACSLSMDHFSMMEATWLFSVLRILKPVMLTPL